MKRQHIQRNEPNGIDYDRLKKHKSTFRLNKFSTNRKTSKHSNQNLIFAKKKFFFEMN